MKAQFAGDSFYFYLCIRMNDMTRFKAALRNRGMKATPQRIAVHKAMMRLGHASADAVAKAISEDSDVKITTASVYNTLALMSSIGLYGNRLSLDNKMYFDVITEPHVHFYDRVNSEYKDIQDDDILSLVEEHFRTRHFRGYKLERIEIQLVCRPTRKKKA